MCCTQSSPPSDLERFHPISTILSSPLIFKQILWRHVVVEKVTTGEPHVIFVGVSLVVLFRVGSKQMSKSSKIYCNSMLGSAVFNELDSIELLVVSWMKLE